MGATGLKIAMTCSCDNLNKDSLRREEEYLSALGSNGKKVEEASSVCFVLHD